MKKAERYTPEEAQAEASRMQEKIKKSEAKDYSSAEIQVEQETTEMEMQAREMTREMNLLVEEYQKGTIDIGELSAELEKYENKAFSNPKPKNIEMPTVIDYRGITAEGALLTSEGISSNSPEFKNYLESNTDINKFIEEFNSAEDQSYNNFKKIVAKYEKNFNEHGIHIGYYKLGVSGDVPQKMTLEVYGDKKEEYKDKFFGKEENYGEKMEIYNRKEEVLSNFYKTLENLREMSAIDKKLVDLKRESGMSDDELRKYFKVDNLVMVYQKLKPLIETVINADLKQDNIFAKIQDLSSVEGDYIVDTPLNDEHLQDSDARKLWGRTQRKYPAYPVKIYSDGINIVADGKMGTIRHKPNMKYEDFEGGQTHRFPENEIRQLVDVKKSVKGIEITYIDGNQEEKKEVLEFEK